VADTHESPGQDVDEKSPQKLISRDGHDLLLTAVGVVLPAKRDSSFAKSDEPMVGDGDTVGVAGEIVEHMLSAAEGRLGIDDPLLRIELSQEMSESLSVGQVQQRAMELELALQQQMLEFSEELATEDTAENADGQQES
jgi:hypothetical protein